MDKHYFNHLQNTKAVYFLLKKKSMTSQVCELQFIILYKFTNNNGQQ